MTIPRIDEVPGGTWEPTVGMCNSRSEISILDAGFLPSGNLPCKDLHLTRIGVLNLRTSW